MAEFDAIVVGSGISGGWVAKELCERGLKVLVLERGGPIDPAKDYSDTEPPWERPHFDRLNPAEKLADYPIQGNVYAMRESNKHLWVKDSDHPYATPEQKPFTWYRGYQVGGRSLIWGRMSYRLSDYDFGANKKDGTGIDWPVRYAEISPWYDKVEEFIGVSGMKEGLAQLPDGKFLPPFEMTCAEKEFKQRLEAKWPTRRLTIGRSANLRVATEEQKALGRGACQARDMCFHGCSYGAYFSSNSSTIPAAERTGNLTLQPNAIVHSLEYDNTTKRVTGVRYIDALTKEPKTVTAKMVFLNASALTSALILQNSATPENPRGLANQSDQLGRNIMDHVGGPVMWATLKDFDGKTVYGRRPTVSYLPRYGNITETDQDYQRGFAYQVYYQQIGWSGKRPGLGAAFKEQNRTPRDWRIALHPYGEVLPNPENRITPHKTKKDQWGLPLPYIEATYGENEQKLILAAYDDAIEMFDKLGLTHVQAPKREDVGVSTPGSYIHEMGTARMGNDPSQSVLNKWNQSHEIDNLFITDGAFMTSSATQNPSLTYMAFSARAAHYAADLLQSGRL